MSSAIGRSSCWSIIGTISSISAGEPSSVCVGTLSTRPDLPGAVADARPLLASGARQPLACPPRPELQVRLARELVNSCRPLNRDRELDQSSNSGSRHRAGSARAARLCRCHRRETARRDRPDRPLQERRATRPPQRRRPTRSELRPHPAPPARPRRQPPTQRRPLPNRDHPSPISPRRPRLPRTQTSRRQKQARSHPLPQTTPRPRRLQHPQSEPRLDIGATLAPRIGVEAACVDLHWQGMTGHLRPLDHRLGA